jgi:hypothetical protein
VSGANYFAAVNCEIIYMERGVILRKNTRSVADKLPLTNIGRDSTNQNEDRKRI